METQEWYWEEGWQELEQEADEDIINDRIYEFDDIEDALEFLDDTDS